MNFRNGIFFLTLAFLQGAFLQGAFLQGAFLQGLLPFQTTPAFANASLDLGQAKTDGSVGEHINGYLQATGQNSSPQVQSLVTTVNQKRKAKYQSIAARRGTSLKAVEALAGKTAIQKTAPGRFVNLGSGWSKK